MTAEVSVMNKGAVAMAADSAITVVGKKIYNSGSKLFHLSKEHSVGLMIYGNAALMGVPWETIVAEYRLTIIKKRFGTVKEIGENFLAFLAGSDRLFPASLQKQHLINLCHMKYSLTVEEINKKIGAEIQKSGKIDENVVAQIVEDAGSASLREWEAAPFLPNATEEKFNELLEFFRADINDNINQVYQKLPLSTELRERLVRLAPSIALKRWLFVAQKSGVVLCGFGDNEIYPAQYSVEIESIVSGIAKYDVPNSICVSDQISAYIQPFAQRDVAMSFLEGIDPNFRKILDDYFGELFSNLNLLINKRIELPDEKKQEMANVINELGSQALNLMRSHLQKASREKFVDPVINAVQILPKDDLAVMAETLVSLTSFRRKMSLDVESVGGPVDVAVISKKDGFIWIKRKHYFNPDLNRDFFERKNER